ncbi:unnamed protein product [Didymodactylos carnosus]|uniref:Uncharacterized protein n=1 Tax=Didymodactylos carnosus TaxID=1234261 RepID=A0A8S2FJF2_9BILA|nr:unnamed protein product [Didymodactylos carnosus]CAF4273920.1 unnamed protein product [Didymodactylos carnosus]
MDSYCIFIYFVFLTLFHNVYTSSFSKKHAGHLKAFGSAGPFLKIDELNEFPSSFIFFNNYLRKSQTVLFRQVLSNDPYLSMWQKDERLKSVDGLHDAPISVETVKKEDRKQNILQMTFSQLTYD